MIKLTGLVMIMFSTVSAGFYAAAKINKRAEILENCIRLLQQINSDIGYNAEPLSVIISKASRCNEFNNLLFLHKISRLESENIILSWRESIEAFSKSAPITKDDAAILISFGEKLGTTDIEHQKKLCDEYIALLKQRYENLQKNRCDRIRMCKVCSIALGVIMLILLI